MAKEKKFRGYDINFLQTMIKIFCGLLFIFFFTGFAQGKDAIYTSFFSSQAAGGYDVVSYFQGETPKKGMKKYSLSYKKATWLFSSQENLDLFKENKQKYLPQYGGYCAYAIAQGQTAKGDPLQWDIHEGKLYFNYNKSIKEKWSADKDNYIQKSEAQWPKVLQN